jgi:hypothetical protein
MSTRLWTPVSSLGMGLAVSFDPGKKTVLFTEDKLPIS